MRFKHFFSMVLSVIVLYGVVSTSGQASSNPSNKIIKDMVIEESAKSPLVPAFIALAVARVESNFNPDALSSAGARGVMQIMPATAQYELDIHPDDLWDARTNIRAGIEFLGELYRQYGYRWDAALSHYNGGTLKGKPLTAKPHGYTKKYVKNVLQFARSFDQKNIELAEKKAMKAARDPKIGDAISLIDGAEVNSLRERFRASLKHSEHGFDSSNTSEALRIEKLRAQFRDSRKRRMLFRR